MRYRAQLLGGLLFLMGANAFALSRFPSSLPEARGAVSAAEVCREDLVPAMRALPAAMAAYDQALHEKGDQLESFILTEERKAKVSEVFALAKEAHLAYLRRAAARFPSPGWAEVIDTVSKVELRQSLRGEDSGSPEFGARLIKARDGAGTQVLVPGISLVVDRAPEILLFLLLHELSHAVDPDVYPVPLTGASGSVFTDPVRCLRTPESVRARVGDPACFARAAGKKEKMHLKEAAESCRRRSEGLKMNPDFSASGTGCGCDEPQGTEAFADWLGAEALAGMPAERITTTSALGWICATYVAEGKRDEELARLPGGDKMLASIRQMDTHPALSDRIERILLAQPRLLKALFPGEKAGARYCPLSVPAI